MNVFYYDVEKKLSLGNVESKKTLKQLLEISDVVSLHVPETKETKNMINKKTLAYMKTGSYLVNASRGTVVEINDLVECLESGHIL
jgi:D-3-phosphoglycerate dehydrogenase